MRKSLFVCAAAALFAVPIATAVSTTQLGAQSQPTFDVVSVKRNASGGGGMRMLLGPANLSAQSVNVHQLIRDAYRLQPFQIIGGPEWMHTDRFDIEARFDPSVRVPGFDTPPLRMSAMLKQLLADRFNLVARTETRELPVYALVLARSDGRLGPQLKPSTIDCAALAAARGRGGPPPDGRRGGGPGLEGRGAPPPGTPFSLGERPQCGGRSGFGQLMAGGAQMAQLVTQLAQLTSRTVIDRTGLTGSYDIDLKWTPTPDQLPQGPPPPGFQPPPIDPDGPSLFTALQEQLGLRLDAQRGPVDVLVIDRLEPPTEN